MVRRTRYSSGVLDEFKAGYPINKDNGGYTPWGTAMVEGITRDVSSAVQNIAEASQADNFGGQLLRSAGGVLNFVGEAAEGAKEISKDPSLSTLDPIGTASNVALGTTLRGLDAFSEGLGKVGGDVVEKFGGDRRIGEFSAQFIPDLLIGRGAGTLNKATQALRWTDKFSDLATVTNVGSDVLTATQGGGGLSPTVMQIVGSATAGGKVKKAKVFKEPSRTASKIPPKRDALNLYNRLVKDGYEIPPSLQRKAKKIQTKDFTLDEGITVWSDKEAYRKAAQNAYDAGIPSADIRQNIGVFKDVDGEIYQMMSRKKGPTLDMRSISEGANTDFNRKLALLQQQNKGTKAYNSAENVKILMERMNFQGTAKDFTAKYAIHHRRTIAAYEPFFSGLNSKDAAKLRELISTVIDPKTNKGIKLGDDIDNLVAIPKNKHTLDKDSIHTLFREFGIEGSSKWPWLKKGQKYNAQDALREKFKKANVEQRFEAFKLYQEYVQQPGDEMLQKIIDAMT